MKKKDRVTKLLTLSFRCGNCNGDVTIDSNKGNFWADSSECDLCGSHGHITVSFWCPACNAHQTVEVYDY